MSNFLRYAMFETYNCDSWKKSDARSEIQRHRTLAMKVGQIHAMKEKAGVFAGTESDSSSRASWPKTAPPGS